LPAQAADYGFFDSVIVNREGLVTIETNRYSVPAHLMGQALTARIYAQWIELFADQELVATHERRTPQNGRFIDPAHFEAAFRTKPRGRVMVYRDWLCRLSPTVSTYVQELSYKRRQEMNSQVIALYDLAQELGESEFLAALELATEQQMYGAEYLRAIVSPPPESVETCAEDLGPSQKEVDRDLALYEQYVANRESLSIHESRKGLHA
jgi:hypothetical protein